MGVLGFYRKGSASFTAEQRSLMDEFGKRVSLTLHRAELLDSANRSNERLKTGLELTLELASALDYREVIRRLLRRAVESVGADRASLGAGRRLGDDRRGRLRPRWAADPGGRSLRDPIRLADRPPRNDRPPQGRRGL